MNGGDEAWLNHSMLAAVRGDAVAAVTAVLGENLAVVDTEFQRTRIAEIAVSRLMRASGGCVVVGGTPRRRLSADERAHFGFELPHTWLIDPGEPLGWPVPQTTGLRNDDLTDAGTFDVHIPRLAHLLGRVGYLVGWNIGNDRNHLERALREAGVSFPRLLWVDVAKMFFMLHPEVGVNPKSVCKLSDACHFYGIRLGADEAHTALFDVLATCEVLIRVCDEWLSAGMKRNDLKIEVTGHHGTVWDPRLSNAAIAPIKWRLPPARLDLHPELRRADVRLRQVRVIRLLNDAFYRWSADRRPRLSDDSGDARQQWRASEEYRQLKATLSPYLVRSVDFSDLT